MPFRSLGLRAELLRAVSDEGYEQPTPVQTRAIPVVLAGRDLMAEAQTGTGKTAAFVLPLLQLLSAPPKGDAASDAAALHPVRALILTPTRELAAQVEESVKTYGRHLPQRSAVIFGGVSAVPQLAALRKGVDIVVATPGRLLDHINQKNIDLSRIEVLVLDEADRMLDMGFIRDIRKILAVLPRERQNLLFSATFSDEIKKLAGDILRSPRDGPGGSAQRAARAGGAGDPSRRPASQAGAALAPDRRRKVEAGSGLHAHQARGQPARAATGAGRHHRHGHSRQQEPGRAHPGARELQARHAARAGGHRHRLAGARHRSAPARGELRAAARSGGLRAPHRPHRSRGHRGGGGLAGLRGRAQAPRRHRTPAQAGIAPHDDARVRTGSLHQGGADREGARAVRRRQVPVSAFGGAFAPEPAGGIGFAAASIRIRRAAGRTRGRRPIRDGVSAGDAITRAQGERRGRSVLRQRRRDPQRASAPR